MIFYGTRNRILKLDALFCIGRIPAAVIETGERVYVRRNKIFAYKSIAQPDSSLFIRNNDITVIRNMRRYVLLRNTVKNLIPGLFVGNLRIKKTDSCRF